MLAEFPVFVRRRGCFPTRAEEGGWGKLQKLCCAGISSCFKIAPRSFIFSIFRHFLKAKMQKFTAPFKNQKFTARFYQKLKNVRCEYDRLNGLKIVPFPRRLEAGMNCPGKTRSRIYAAHKNIVAKKERFNNNKDSAQPHGTRLNRLDSTTQQTAHPLDCAVATYSYLASTLIKKGITWTPIIHES